MAEKEIVVTGCGGLAVILKEHNLNNRCPWCGKKYSEHRGGPDFKENNG